MKHFSIFTLNFTILILTLSMIASCTNDTNPLVSDKLDDNTITSTSDVPDVFAKAINQTEREVIDIDLTVPSACLDEMVRLEGPVSVRIHTTIDGRGVMHQQAFYSWKDVTATGEDSGNTWHTTAALELYVMSNYEGVDPFQPVPDPDKVGDPSVFHHTGAMLFLADDEGNPNLHVRHLVHIVTDPDGNVSVEKDEFELLGC